MALRDITHIRGHHQATEEPDLVGVPYMLEAPRGGNVDDDW